MQQALTPELDSEPFNGIASVSRIASNRVRDKLNALFTRRQDGWGPRDDISRSQHLVAAFMAGRVKLRMWRLSAWDCWLAGGDDLHLTGGESPDHARLKAAASLAMGSQGAEDADLEQETMTGRADAYSRSRNWIVECGNTRFSKLRQAVMHDSHPRFTLIPYQPTHCADGTPRRLIAIDFEWSRDLTVDLQAEDWAAMERIADVLELDDLPPEPMRSPLNATLIAGLVAIALTGCSPSAEEVGTSSYDPAKLSYFQDRRTGLCFAVSAYSRMDTGGRLSGGVSHAAVPCSDPVMKLVR